MTFRLRLILGFGLASFLPLILLSAVTIYSAANFTTDNARRSLQQKIELIAPEFGNLISDLSYKLRVLSQADVFEGNDPFAKSKYLNEVIAEIKSPLELHYFGPEGEEIARSGAISGKIFEMLDLGIEPSLFEEILNSKQGDVFLTDTLTSVSGQKYFVAASPVTDDSNLVIIGVIAAKVPLSFFDGLMSRVRSSVGAGQIAYVLKRNGEVLIPPSLNGHFGVFDGFSDDKSGWEVEQGLIREFEKIGVAGNFERTGSTGLRELVVFHKLTPNPNRKDHSWHLVVRSSLDAIVGPAYDLAKEIAIIGLVAIFSATFAGIVVARSFTSTVDKIAEGANQLVAGDIDFTSVAVEPVETGPRELVTLSQALSRAVGVISSRTHDLEMARQAAESAREEAERSSSARAAFLAIMSHEIRTPLNGMLGMIQLLEMNEDLTEQQAEYLGLARGAGESLLQILTDVLDLSKIESEAFELEDADFSIDEVVSPVLSIYEQTASDSVKLHHNCLIAPGLRLLGDPVRIRQIMWNLIGNAVKFTPEGSVNVESRVRTEEETSRKILAVTISDTGVGIREEDRQKILEPFNQADTSLTRPFEGVGLGLTIVQKLISAMDGDLKIASIVGKGTVVSVDIPIKVLDQNIRSEPTGKTSFAAQVEKGQAGATALVVDDNKLNAIVAAEMLNKAGMRTFVASGGREALEILGQQAIDFVILDQHMPIMDGTSTAAAIRNHADQNVSQVKIVGLTADARVSNKEAMKQAGMNIVLTKPVRHEALLLALQNLPPAGDGRSSLTNSSAC